MRYVFRAAVVSVLAGILYAEQESPALAQPVLRVQTDVVVVPFQVRRGSRSVTDLAPRMWCSSKTASPTPSRASNLHRTIHH